MFYSAADSVSLSNASNALFSFPASFPSNEFLADNGFQNVLFSLLNGAVGQSCSELKFSIWKPAWWRVRHEHLLNFGNFFPFCFWDIEKGVNAWNETKTTKNEKCISSNDIIKNWISETNQCISQPVYQCCNCHCVWSKYTICQSDFMISNPYVPYLT